MFTGIINASGVLKDTMSRGSNKLLVIETNNDFNNDIQIGDSISIDGVCLTVEKIDNNRMHLTSIDTTVKKSIIHFYKKQAEINLEKSITLKTYLGGHIVNGHVDTIGEVIKEINTGKKITLTINIVSSFGKYLINNDSIAVNGVSLTIKSVYGNNFSIEIIPETIKRTNLIKLRSGSKVNVEINHITKAIYEFTKRGPR